MIDSALGVESKLPDLPCSPLSFGSEQEDVQYQIPFTSVGANRIFQLFPPSQKAGLFSVSFLLLTKLAQTSTSVYGFLWAMVDCSLISCVVYCGTKLIPPCEIIDKGRRCHSNLKDSFCQRPVDKKAMLILFLFCRPKAIHRFHHPLASK